MILHAHFNFGEVVDWVTALGTLLAIGAALYIANRDRRDREAKEREDIAVQKIAQEVALGPRISSVSAKLDLYLHHLAQAAANRAIDEHAFDAFFKLDADDIARLMPHPAALDRDLAYDILKLIANAREIEKAVYMGTPIMNGLRICGAFNIHDDLKTVISRAADGANRILGRMPSHSWGTTTRQ